MCLGLQEELLCEHRSGAWVWQANLVHCSGCHTQIPHLQQATRHRPFKTVFKTVFETVQLLWKMEKRKRDRLWGHPIELPRCCEENRVAVSFINLLHQAGMGFSMRQFPFFFFIIKKCHMFSLYAFPPSSSTHTKK